MFNSTGQSGIRQWPVWARIGLWIVATRVIAQLAMVAGTFWPWAGGGWIGQSGSLFYRQVPNRWLDVWGRWDSSFYLNIAARGYPPPPAEGWAYDAAYYPLLSCLMRGLSELLGGASLYFCAVFLVNAFFVLGLVYLYRLVRLDESQRFAEEVLLVALAYPGSHFLSVVYPDSLMFFLGVFALYAARTGRFVVAGLAMMLAAVTRSSGVLLTVPVLLEMLRGPDGRWRANPWALVVLFVPLSVGPFLMLHQKVYGDPFYFMHVQAGWGRHPTFPLEPLFSFDLSPDYHLFALVGMALVVFGFRRRERPSYWASAAITLMLPLSTGILHGIHRYLASNFPLYVFAARWFENRPRAKLVYRVVGLALMALFAFQWGKNRHPN